MHEQRKQFMQLLQNDEQLLAMLATNKPFWNSNLESEKRYSILPADKIYDGIQTPFVTVQISADNLLGTNLSDVFIYVRCYNRSDKTFVGIDNILSRVKVLLHRHRFSQYADNAISVDCLYETTGAELTDQAYDLLFRESQYRLLYL